jgi:hypothetical protein
MTEIEELQGMRFENLCDVNFSEDRIALCNMRISEDRIALRDINAPEDRIVECDIKTRKRGLLCVT